MYDSKQARFLSEDPLGFDAGDTNLYRYVSNSPTNYTDPYGKEAVAPRPVKSPPPVNTPPVVPPPVSPPPGTETGIGLALIGFLKIAVPTIAIWSLLERPTTKDSLNELNFCPANMPEEDPWPIPWRERKKWPKGCQLENQFPGPPGKDFDYCTYICRDWGRTSPIITTVKKGGKCAKWHDWVPVPHP